METIGVLSIITIIATAVVPAVFQQIRDAEQTAEARTVAAIAQAYEQVVLERKLLPGTNDWVEWLAPALDRSTTQLATSPGGAPRLILYHPDSAIRPGAVARFQTASGFQSVSPGQDRLVVVSTLTGVLPPLSLFSTRIGFESLWNTKPGERPERWPAVLLPDARDLQMARVDLNKLLHRVVINNVTSGNLPAAISLEENGTVLSIPKPTPNMPWERSFVHGTGLNLHAPMVGIWGRELITQDRTLYYSEDGWGLPSFPALNGFGPPMMTLVADFLSASFPEAKNAQRPRAAIDELYRAMWSYMDWAEADFLEAGNNKKQTPDAYVVRSTIARLNEGTLNLIGSGGGGG